MSEQTGATAKHFDIDRLMALAETGATIEQIEAAGKSIWERDSNATKWDRWDDWRDYYCTEVWEIARSLVPPGYRIVPADAVVVTAEVAATAAEACDSWAISCAVSARQEKSVGHHDVAEAAERRYAACKAAAAALRGEG